MSGSDTAPPDASADASSAGTPAAAAGADRVSEGAGDEVAAVAQEGADSDRADEPGGEHDGELADVVSALGQLHKMSAPDSLGRDVEETIRRRSAGRFFGRKAFGDRVPFEVLAVIALILGLVIFALLRSSATGSLRYDSPPEEPNIAPGARDVLPRPPPAQ
ncbi:MAG: hypothetical protein AAGC55_03975 [Myxococcota bacterium]